MPRGRPKATRVAARHAAKVIKEALGVRSIEKLERNSNGLNTPNGIPIAGNRGAAPVSEQ